MNLIRAPTKWGAIATAKYRKRCRIICKIDYTAFSLKNKGKGGMSI